MAYNKGIHSSTNGGNRKRRRRYALMLLLALGAALLGVFALHKLRERRIYYLLVKDKDRQLLSLDLLLQKEKDYSRELKRKNEEIKAKIYSLRSQKRELQTRVMEMQSIMDSLKDEKKMIETALAERQNEIKMLQEKVVSLGKVHLDCLALTENLKRKEAEIEDLKHELGLTDRNHWVSPKEKSSANYGNGKNITNEGELRVGTEDKIGYRMGIEKGLVETGKPFWSKEAVQVEDPSGTGTAEKRAGREQGKKSEDSRDDGSVNLAAKGIGVRFMDSKENKTLRKEQQLLLENDNSGGSRVFHGKQLADGSRISEDVRGNDAPSDRIKGKGWKMVAKNRIEENIGTSESHRAADKRNGKTYTDEQDGLEERIVRTIFHNENLNRNWEEGGMDDNNPAKNKTEARLLKTEDRDTSNRIADDLNYQVTSTSINLHPRKESRREGKQLEDQEDSVIQQNWSRRHINKVEENERVKSGTFDEKHQDPEELNTADAEENERDAIDVDNDDFFKESQFDFEDDKEENKGEIDQSDFQEGLQ